jgi:hypothetical protein
MKVKGPEDEETREFFRAWEFKRHEELDRTESRTADIRFQIEAGDLCYEAGFPDMARAFYEDALYQEAQEKLGDLEREVREKLEKVQ